MENTNSNGNGSLVSRDQHLDHLLRMLQLLLSVYDPSRSSNSETTQLRLATLENELNALRKYTLDLAPYQQNEDASFNGGAGSKHPDAGSGGDGGGQAA